jgi:adenine-specific DNA-methyltransferase
MISTQFQAKFFAHQLTRRHAPDSSERLASAVAGAQVDLNPHQVDAALFAFASPFSKGALLADEVGLGKTIEAGLVISQRWAERRRRILVIVPSNLRKQWHQELTEKFFLPCLIMESKSYSDAVGAGNVRPFDRPGYVVICSYQFARNKALDVKSTAWDLVVIDEAHRLRNVYKPSNVIANALKDALADKQKLLLTATPLQNSLLELYGLVSFIDDHTFGDVKSFRDQFLSTSPDRMFPMLRDRLKPVCHRTLRRQVTQYVPYTKRHAMLEEFTPEDSEDRLYQLVSDYLQRENLQALPASQRSLMTLVLRKLLASSTFAIAGALTSIARRLQAKLDQDDALTDPSEELRKDFEGFEETAEEWGDEDHPEHLTQSDRKAIQAEIAELTEFARLASSISENGKGKALLKGLAVAFDQARELGGDQKAIIFTESRKTQSYLLRILADSPYADGIVLFNGTNTDEGSKAIYAEWTARHEGSDKITGSRTADMRSALVDYFRERGSIMIATEAGAEGINLQFCSLVVNYDLPWNPQRIEQRIGRCHRYGQKNDVVVLNFVNRKNDADKRVFRLLSEKFKLFEGVFGASDEVLGAIESGVDFEKRIGAIYQKCRQPDEIRSAFDELQTELSVEINEAMSVTRQKLLENFDDEVREKLRVRNAEANEYIGIFEKTLIGITRHELSTEAEFVSDTSFELKAVPAWAKTGDIPTGLYELPRRSRDAHLYRANHPLGEAVLDRAKGHEIRPIAVTFDYEAHAGKVSQLEALRGQCGWLSAVLLTVNALDTTEDHVLISVIADDGTRWEDELARRLLSLPAHNGDGATLQASMQEGLSADLAQQTGTIQQTVAERNSRFFGEEADKLDGWADDLKQGLEREIKEIDRQIRDARRGAVGALKLEDKLSALKEVKALEQLRTSKRRTLFEAQDQIDHQRNELISQIEAKLEQKVVSKPLFQIRWILK